MQPGESKEVLSDLSSNIKANWLVTSDIYANFYLNHNQEIHL
jgi:hypothetical protein